MAIGISWFFIGLFKKVIIADTLAPVADAVFAHPQGYGLAAQWTGVLCYSLQLYFDFSGYSDMAVALARIFSIRFPINFNSPYKAASVIDFWQRWHMTLTRYLTLYVYDPIAVAITRRRLTRGKSVSKRAFRTPEGFVSLVVLPTVFTMFVAGVWHGAGFQFLIFGLLHGFYLTVNHAWRIFVPAGSRLRQFLPTPVSVLLTYLAILVPQIFFRSNSAADAGYTLATMAGFHGRGLPLTGNPNTHLAHSVGLINSPVLLVFALAACYLVVWAFPNTQEVFGEGSSGAGRYSLLLARIRMAAKCGVGVVSQRRIFRGLDVPGSQQFVPLLSVLRVGRECRVGRRDYPPGQEFVYRVNLVAFFRLWRSSASPIRRSIRSAKAMPLCSHILGYMLIEVKPGMVLISLM